MDKIHLNNLRFFGRHGALPEENILGQVYEVSLGFELDTRKAAQTDDLGLTLDYREAIETTRRILTGPSLKLIETLADKLAHTLIADFPLIQAVTVRLTKPHPPVGIDLPGVTIEIRRTRDDS